MDYRFMVMDKRERKRILEIFITKLIQRLTFVSIDLLNNGYSIAHFLLANTEANMIGLI